MWQLYSGDGRNDRSAHRTPERLGGLLRSDPLEPRQRDRGTRGGAGHQPSQESFDRHQTHNVTNFDRNSRPNWHVPVVSRPKGSNLYTIDFGHSNDNTWFRFGYYQYSPGFTDQRFCGRHYYFRPNRNRCVYSPFYFYWMLPPYIGCDNVIYVSTRHVSVWYDTDWHSPDSYGSQDLSELDYEIEDLASAFRNRDMRTISYMVPTDGHVAIYLNDEYRYSLGSDDFYDTLRDGIENVQTIDYDILSVSKDSDGDAKVIARHEFVDTFGQTQFVYHTFRLNREGHGYVIREFGTSDTNPL